MASVRRVRLPSDPSSLAGTILPGPDDAKMSGWLGARASEEPTAVGGAASEPRGRCTRHPRRFPVPFGSSGSTGCSRHICFFRSSAGLAFPVPLPDPDNATDPRFLVVRHRPSHAHSQQASTQQVDEPWYVTSSLGSCALMHVPAS